MAVNTAKVLVRQAASTTLTNPMYSVPASTKTIITNIVVANTGSSVATFTIKFDGIDAISNSTIAAFGVAVFDIKQVLDATKIIAGGASTTAVTFHISGVEIV